MCLCVTWLCICVVCVCVSANVCMCLCLYSDVFKRYSAKLRMLGKFQPCSNCLIKIEAMYTVISVD